MSAPVNHSWEALFEPVTGSPRGPLVGVGGLPPASVGVGRAGPVVVDVVADVVVDVVVSGVVVAVASVVVVDGAVVVVEVVVVEIVVNSAVAAAVPVSLSVRENVLKY